MTQETQAIRELANKHEANSNAYKQGLMNIRQRLYSECTMVGNQSSDRTREGLLSIIDQINNIIENYENT